MKLEMLWTDEQSSLCNIFCGEIYGAHISIKWKPQSLHKITMTSSQLAFTICGKLFSYE